jgi:hypothetical protein
MHFMAHDCWNSTKGGGWLSASSGAKTSLLLQQFQDQLLLLVSLGQSRNAGLFQD